MAVILNLKYGKSHLKLNKIIRLIKKRNFVKKTLIFYKKRRITKKVITYKGDIV